MFRKSLIVFIAFCHSTFVYAGLDATVRSSATYTIGPTVFVNSTGTGISNGRRGTEVPFELLADSNFPYVLDTGAQLTVTDPTGTTVFTPANLPSMTSPFYAGSLGANQSLTVTLETNASLLPGQSVNTFSVLDIAFGADATYDGTSYTVSSESEVTTSFMHPGDQSIQIAEANIPFVYTAADNFDPHGVLFSSAGPVTRNLDLLRTGHLNQIINATAAVPEPSPALLLSCMFLSFGVLKYRRKQLSS